MRIPVCIWALFLCLGSTTCCMAPVRSSFTLALASIIAIIIILIIITVRSSFTLALASIRVGSGFGYTPEYVRVGVRVRLASSS